MKKLIFLAATLVTLSLISCEGPQGPMGPAGRDGEGTSWYSTSITVYENEWILMGDKDGLNSYFVAYKPLNALTSTVYNYGSVIAYYEIDPGVKNGMPYVWHRGGEDEQGEFFWTETYDFDFVVGEVGFYVTYSDFSTKVRPGTEKFHVVLMW